MGAAGPGTWAFWNGRFVPAAEAAVAPSDAGFVSGATVSDVARTFGQQLFRHGDHVRRFRRDCVACHIPLTFADSDIERIADEIVARNRPADGGELLLVTVATPGPLSAYSEDPETLGPTFGLHTVPLRPGRFRRLFTEGARLLIPDVTAVPRSSLDPRLKMRSRMVWWIANARVRAIDPLADALLLDETGHVTETASANLLVVRDGTIVTPPKETTLDGLSRAITEELAAGLGIPFRYAALTVEDCLSADELLLSSTPYGLAGVGRLQGIDRPADGPMLRRLRQAWAERTCTDIESQILNSK